MRILSLSTWPIIFSLSFFSVERRAPHKDTLFYSSSWEILHAVWDFHFFYFVLFCLFVFFKLDIGKWGILGTDCWSQNYSLGPILISCCISKDRAAVRPHLIFSRRWGSVAERVHSQRSAFSKWRCSQSEQSGVPGAHRILEWCSRPCRSWASNPSQDFSGWAIWIVRGRGPGFRISAIGDGDRKRTLDRDQEALCYPVNEFSGYQSLMFGQRHLSVKNTSLPLTSICRNRFHQAFLTQAIVQGETSSESLGEKSRVTG